VIRWRLIELLPSNDILHTHRYRDEAMFPRGQISIDDFPRFGLPQYASRFPSNVNNVSIEVTINGGDSIGVDISSGELPRCTIKSDFHCVTTWSYIGAEWSGVKLSDIFEKYVVQNGTQAREIAGAVFYAQDGYKTSLVLEDLLGEQVMLADMLDGKPLSIEHGAPIRLVSPEQYGYKNLKHLSKIEFYANMPILKRGVKAFLDHPRARVSKEERGRWIPGWVLRYIYRLFIPGTVRDFKAAIVKYKANKQ